MLTSNNRKPDLLLYAGWITLNALCIPIAWGITIIVITQIEKVIGGTIQVNGQTRITEDYLASFVLFPLLGLITGLSQYLLLRRYLAKVGWWVVATFLGWILPFTIMQLVFTLFPIGEKNFASILRTLIFFLMGGLLGLIQWFVLRKRIQDAGWWILANSLGWGLAIWITGGDISNPLANLSVALLPPMVTCFTLWVLLSRLPRKE